MTRYRPTDDEAHAAFAVAQRRNSMNGGQTNLPGGETANEMERLIQHYVACLSEIAVSRVTNLCWTGCSKGAHGHLDVGDKYEVRSITERNRGLLVRPKDLDKGIDPPYVLVFVNEATRECDVIGWERPTEVVENGRVFQGESHNPCWILSQDKLRVLSELP